MPVTFHPGTVLMVNLAFSSQMGTKRRPVVVLRDAGDSDLLVAPITSQSRRVSLDIEIKDWRKSGLSLPSIVRTEKMATIEKSAVLDSMGGLSDQDWSNVIQAIAFILTEITKS